MPAKAVDYFPAAPALQALDIPRDARACFTEVRREMVLCADSAMNYASHSRSFARSFFMFAIISAPVPSALYS